MVDKLGLTSSDECKLSPPSLQAGHRSQQCTEGEGEGGPGNGHFQHREGGREGMGRAWSEGPPGQNASRVKVSTEVAGQEMSDDEVLETSSLPCSSESLRSSDQVDSTGRHTARL